MAQNARKRPAKSSQGPAKKRKLSAAKSSGTKPRSAPIKSKGKGKEKASSRTTIPIPAPAANDDSDVSDEDATLLEEAGSAAAFLGRLDHTAIARSKKETDRLHRLNRPVRQPQDDDDLPSVNSHSEDEGPWSSDISPSDEEDVGSEVDQDESDLDEGDVDSDAEMPYETMARKPHLSWHDDDDAGIKRLPIKLANGRIQKSGETISLRKVRPVDESEDESQESEREDADAGPQREDVATGARFGRAAVVDVVGAKSRAARIQGAKEQIAGICQEIVGDPENSLGLLRRLHTFSLERISTPSHPEPVLNDPVVRKLAILSQLAVFKDIIPGYRIRPLTDKEKAEKVSQMVARTRDWEQGMVGVYQTYLRSLEQELKVKSELADVALQCICTLVVEATHFNFRVNLISALVARLSKKSWDKSSELCLNTLISVFRADLSGQASLEVVRLLNRMVKERKYSVHPGVLSCLLHLRLKTELGVRSSESKADKEESQKAHTRGKAAARRAKGKPTDQPHHSKKAAKLVKERKEIEKEMHEAEAEVDKEERATTQTETLKLLFVLYFRILKNPTPTPLLPAALQGISRYAHLVNIDFFKDLMQILKQLINFTPDDSDDTHDPSQQVADVRRRLQCIITAFELLGGQGEALNIDLTDFITSLYTIILPLSLSPDIEAPPSTASPAGARTAQNQTTADLLFRALNLVFSPRALGSSAPAWRSAAFAKRLMTAATGWPPATAVRALDFVAGLLAKDPSLDALLCTDDRTANGVYRPDLDDPQLCNAFGTSLWEVFLLQDSHWDARVRDEARKLVGYTRQ